MNCSWGARAGAGTGEDAVAFHGNCPNKICFRITFGLPGNRFPGLPKTIPRTIPDNFYVFDTQENSKPRIWSVPKSTLGITFGIPGNRFPGISQAIPGPLSDNPYLFDTPKNLKAGILDVKKKPWERLRNPWEAIPRNSKSDPGITFGIPGKRFPGIPKAILGSLSESLGSDSQGFWG